MSKSSNPTYNVSRSNAARLLSVSVRTIDRYLNQGKIDYVKTKGRTWLSKDDVKRLFEDELATDPRKRQQFYTETDRDKTQDRQADRQPDRQPDNRPDRQTDRPHERQHERPQYGQEPRQSSHTPKQESRSVVNYQQKTLELSESLNLARRQTFKLSRYITYLQGKISQMKPVEDYNTLQTKLSSTSRAYSVHLKNLEVSYSSKLKRVNLDIHQKDKEIESEKLNRYALIVILVVVLAMQPILWLLLK